MDGHLWERNDDQRGNRHNDDKTFFSLLNTAVNQMDLYLTASDDATLKVQAAISWTFPRGGVAGVIRNDKGQDVLVVQLVTNYHIPRTDERPTNLASPITQFERELYQALLTSSLTTR